MNYRIGAGIYLLALTGAIGVSGQTSQSSASPQGAQDTFSTWRTDGSYNGHFWKDSPESSKTVYLLAYGDAVRFTAVIADRIAVKKIEPGSDAEHKLFHTVAAMCWPGNLIVADVQSALDHFYDAPENLPITIPNALLLIAMRAAGMPEAEIQKEIAHQRTISH